MSAAVAGGLSLPYADTAFAHGTACDKIPALPLPKTFSGCTEPANCTNVRIAIGLERVCAEHKLAECLTGLHCRPGRPHFETCLSTFRGGVANCHVTGHCSGGRVMCECKLEEGRDDFGHRTGRGPECGCQCEMHIPPMTP